MRPTVIGGERSEDDYEVVWRALSIGRIRRAEASSHAELWAWNCWLAGRPCNPGALAGRMACGKTVCGWVIPLRHANAKEGANGERPANGFANKPPETGWD